MTPDGQIAIPLDSAAIREPFLIQAPHVLQAPSPVVEEHGQYEQDVNHGHTLTCHSLSLGDLCIGQGEKYLFDWQNQAMLKSDGRPLGECRIILHWLTSVDNS